MRGDLGESVFDFSLSKVKWKYDNGHFLCDREVAHLRQAMEMGFLEAHCALFDNPKHRIWLRIDAGMDWVEAHWAEVFFMDRKDDDGQQKD